MRCIAFILVVCLLLSSNAQDGNFQLGARNAGMGGSSLTLADGWSVFNNVGGLGEISTSSVDLSYQNRFNIPAFQVVGLAVSQKTKWVNAGVSFFRFGDDLYSQQRFALSLAHKLQMVSLGLSANVLQYRIEGIGTRQSVSLEFGGIAELVTGLRIGAHIFNINQARAGMEKVPVAMKSGLSWQPSSSLLLTAQVRKDLDLDPNLSFGLEYQVVNAIFFRSGFGTSPRLATFGLGINPRRFRLDYAYSIRNPLGGIHELSMGYDLGKK